MTFGKYLPVTSTRKIMAIILAYLAAFECSELGDPRATKMICFGRDRKTVPM